MFRTISADDMSLQDIGRYRWARATPPRIAASSAGYHLHSVANPVNCRRGCRALFVLLMLSMAGIASAQIQQQFCLPSGIWETVTEPGHTPPALIASPVNMSPGQSLTMSISGSYTAARDINQADCPWISAWDMPSGTPLNGPTPHYQWVSVTNAHYVNANLTTLTISISSGAPTGTLVLELSNDTGWYVWYLGITLPSPPSPPSPPPPGCPTPTITKVDPPDWPAGQATPVTMWGSGFSCQGSPQIQQMNITPSVSGSTVQVSPTTFIGSDQITFTVTPEESDPTQPATIDLYGNPIALSMIKRPPARIGKQPARSNSLQGGNAIPGTASVSSQGTPVASANANIQGICKILKPENSSRYNLASSSDYTATGPIPFLSNAPKGVTTNWKVAIHYAASTGKGSSTVSKEFQSTGPAPVNQTFTSVGGLATVTATCGSQSSAPISFTIAGTPVPLGEVIEKLVSLHGGLTPGLMTGFASRESSFMQFKRMTLFDVHDWWPQESTRQGKNNQAIPDGSHIGVLQVPTKMDDAFDWTINAQDGTNLFLEKLRACY